MSQPQQVDTVRSQIEALRRKLLDLSLRNRMLNFRPSRRIGISIVGEESFQLHRLMVEEGKKMTFTGRKDPAKAANSDYLSIATDDVAMAEFRRAAQDELDAYLENPVVPVNVLDTKLNTEDYESVLQAKLRMIARESVTVREELGINTLFLTLGTLEWCENEQRSYRAPLLYVPVSLERQANGTMKVAHDGSDVGTNLPLAAKLKEFNLKLPELDENKEISDYFNEIESTIKNRDDWKVHRDEVHLGFFNYEKYAMYLDLSGDAWPEGCKPWDNHDLQAMLGQGYESAETSISDETQLDDVRPVATACEVFDADNSQIIAMMRAAEGNSIVVEGPPGTGKSQTITNIIAEAVAAKKTVLFVSAKRAALDVVHRNLERADLGAMCLDMHDKLTNRKEFYAELKRTVNRTVVVRDEEAKVTRLADLRSKLNTHSAAVNEPLPEFGTSPFTSMCILAALPSEESEDREGRIPFDSLKGFTSQQIQNALPLIDALQTRIRLTGTPSEHPFWGAGIDYLDPAKRLDLRDGLDRASGLLAEASEAMLAASDALKVKVTQSVANVDILNRCVGLAMNAPPHDGVAVCSSLWTQQSGYIKEVIAALTCWQEVRQEAEAWVKPEIWNADLLSTEFAFEKYASVWYKFLVGTYRKAKQGLEIYLTPSAPQDATERRDLIRKVRSAQAAEALISSNSDLMRSLIGELWQGNFTDPLALDRLLNWILGLSAGVNAGVLPKGMLDYFSASQDHSAVQSLVKVSEQKAHAALDAYVEVAGLLQFNTATAKEEGFQQLQSRCETWLDNLPLLSNFIGLNETRKRLNEASLSSVVAVADQWGLAGERLRDSFVRSYYSGVIHEAVAIRPELRAFEREGHEAAIREFQQLDDFKLSYNRARVRFAHQQLLPTFENAVGNLSLLKVQCELQRRHKPIRWIMSRAGVAVQRIKPVFMMSPLSVAIHLPPELPQFDMVIFDEASQIKPEDALSAIVRAKQCIVVGDTRQMPPTSFFDRLSDDEDDLDESEQEVNTGAKNLESVLSLMSAMTLGRARRPDLRWHYRSVHPSLIQPSNEMFYENRLVIFPSPGVTQNGRRIGVVFHHHPESVYEPGSKKRVNRLEAEIVANHVLTHVLEHPEQSLLVAAMNKPQADLIYTEVQKRERQHPEAFHRYRELHPYEPLDPKNLENIQGDERDVIFISVTYGRDEEGTLRQQFGPLLVDGGERRLNVLITRARQRCEVFSNITADDIRVESQRPGVVALKRYLRFAQDGRLEVPLATGLAEESPFEEEVTAALREQGYEVHPQVGSEGFRIDIGVLDPSQPGRYLIGIECDGATYHQARTARDRDKLRQRLLESRGWRLHRIWSHDWWQDRDGEIRRLLNAIESNVAPLQMEETPEVELEEVIGQATLKMTRPYLVAQATETLVTQDEVYKFISEIVRIEGPIVEALLIVRLREALGVSRLGSNLKPWLMELIHSNGSIQCVRSEFFVSDEQLKVPRDWSTRPTSERKFEYLSTLELMAAIRTVLKHSFGATPDQVIMAAYPLLGFKRVTDSARDRAVGVVKELIESGELSCSPDNILSAP